MARRLPSTDVVIVGLGWTGSILAHELTNAGLNVVALERGPWRDTATNFPTTYVQDELRYHIRHDLFLRAPAEQPMTFRNNASQTALPIRTWGSFMPGNGVGGAGVHWNGETWHFLPSDFQLKTHLTERYGAKLLPEDITVEDWVSPLRNSSPITTNSSIYAAPQERPATSRAANETAGIRTKARGLVTIPRRRRSSLMARSCSRKLPKRWVTIPFPSHLTYIRNSWGNVAPAVSASAVHRVRQKDCTGLGARFHVRSGFDYFCRQ